MRAQTYFLLLVFTVIATIALNAANASTPIVNARVVLAGPHTANVQVLKVLDQPKGFVTIGMDVCGTIMAFTLLKKDLNSDIVISFIADMVDKKCSEGL